MTLTDAWQALINCAEFNPAYANMTEAELMRERARILRQLANAATNDARWYEEYAAKLAGAATA